MRQSQEQRIIGYLATGRTLTPLKALRNFGCFRLGARIYGLRQQGHDITSRLVAIGDKKVAEYRLVR